MTIKELCDGYKKIAAKSMKDVYLKEKIKVKSYYPLVQKKIIAEQAMTQAHVSGEKIVKDSVKEYLLNTYAIIYAYTDIQVDEKNWLEEYDMLDQEGLIGKIVELVPEAERAEFSTIWQMVRDDFLYNNGSVHAMIGKALDGVVGQMEKYLREQGEI